LRQKSFTVRTEAWCITNTFQANEDTSRPSPSVLTYLHKQALPRSPRNCLRLQRIFQSCPFRVINDRSLDLSLLAKRLQRACGIRSQKTVYNLHPEDKNTRTDHFVTDRRRLSLASYLIWNILPAPSTLEDQANPTKGISAVYLHIW